jgi:hypothetical protein
MSELNAVDISNSGNCFRLFVTAFNARQALYEEDKKENEEREEEMERLVH